ncbi:MAG: prolyl oligopeptidase family serine peptidase [Cyclobacteriaceae bacterium]
MKQIITYCLFMLSQVGFSQSGNRNAEAVSFPSAGIQLEGILVKPGNADKYPMVVFQQGSGPHAFENYDKEAWGPHKFYIEDVLLKQGFAVFFCNKRGLGDSKGHWQDNDFYGRAKDAYAAVEYLRTRGDIDTNMIGMSGHSQGGWVSQIVAAEHDDINFVISLAGPTVGQWEQAESLRRYFFKCKGLSGEALDKKVAKKMKWLKRSANIGGWLTIVRSAKHWNLTHDYENDEVLKNIDCPTLLLFGEYDVNVDPVENITYLNKVFDGNIPDNFTIDVMSQGHHCFYQVENRCVPWEVAIKQPFDSEFQGRISDWLAKTVKEN